MAKPNIITEKPISMTELKEEIENIKKRDKELNFRANRTEEYLKVFAQKDLKITKELYEKIEKLNIPRLKPEHITKIVDIIPETVEELKILLQGYTITVNNENMKKIIDTVNNGTKTD